jgi:hypothetical protein
MGVLFNSMGSRAHSGGARLTSPRRYFFTAVVQMGVVAVLVVLQLGACEGVVVLLRVCVGR